MCAGAEQTAGAEFLSAAVSAASLLNQRLEKLEAENCALRQRMEAFEALEAETCTLRQKMEAIEAKVNMPEAMSAWAAETQAEGGVSARLASVMEKLVEKLESENSALKTKMASAEAVDLGLEALKAEVSVLKARLDAETGVLQAKVEALSTSEEKLKALQEKLEVEEHSASNMERDQKKLETMEAAGTRAAAALEKRLETVEAAFRALESATSAIGKKAEIAEALQVEVAAVKAKAEAVEIQAGTRSEAVKEEMCAVQEKMDGLEAMAAKTEVLAGEMATLKLKLDKLGEEVKAGSQACKESATLQKTSDVEALAAANCGTKEASFDVSGKDFSQWKKGQAWRSQTFALGGVYGFYLKFFPKGDELAAQGKCSLFLFHERGGLEAQFRLTVDGIQYTPEVLRVFDGPDDAWGSRSLTNAASSFRTVKVELLELAYPPSA